MTITSSVWCLSSKSPKATVTKYPSVRYTTEKVPGGSFVDEDKMLAESPFPIKPPELVELTKSVLRAGAGVDNPSVLANDFEFCAPVVGPIGKQQYLDALNNFKVTTVWYLAYSLRRPGWLLQNV